jgi:hypothetical protein
VVERERETKPRQRGVEPGDVVPVRLAANRIDQERQQQQKANVQQASDEAGERAERRDEQLLGREGQRSASDDFPRKPIELALDAGFVEYGFRRLDTDRFYRRRGHRTRRMRRYLISPTSL